MRRAGGIAVTLLLLLGAAACSDDDDAADDEATTTTAVAPDDGTTAPDDTTTTAVTGPEQLTPEGLADVRIGMTEAEANASGRVGAFEPTCEEIAGPGYTLAELEAPLDGFVIAYDGEVERLVVRSGEVVTAPGGVRVGDDLDAATAAFEAQEGVTTELDEATEEAFGFWVLHVAQDGEPIYAATVDPTGSNLNSLAVPQNFTCE